MIQAGDLKVKIEKDGPSHARLTVSKDSPPGHLPRKLADVAVDLEQLLIELRTAKIIE